MIPNDDPRRLIARLAVAIAAADGHVTPNELLATEELDLLGLGRLSRLVQEELVAAVDQPIELRETCAGLVGLGPQTGAIILTVLAHIAASEGAVSPREREAYGTIAACLGIPGRDAGHILDAAIAATHARRAQPEEAAERAPAAPAVGASARARAWRVLGLEPGTPRDRLEAAYLAAVERYDPAKVMPLGADFVRLSIRKLAELTDAFDEVRAAG
jgi:tellurite resistance protein